LLDCLGMMIAGRTAERVHRARGVDGPLDHGVILSLACGALGLDDFDEATRAHPGSVIVPALLVAAAAEERPVPGKRFVNAVWLGYEIMAWLGSALDAGSMHLRGRHPSAVLGVPAAACASAWLLGLGEAGVAAALGIGAGFAFGLSQFDAADDVRALQTAHATSSGLRAAFFAKSGFHASHQALEGPGGFFGAHGSQRTSPLEAIGAAPSALERTSFKPYPHFTDLHPAVTALSAALTASSIGPDAIEQIRLLLPHKVVSRLHSGVPESLKQAKRSAGFVLALATRSLLRAGPDLRAPLQRSQLFDREILSLAERVVVVSVPDRDGRDVPESAVEVVLEGGGVLSGTATGYPGDGRVPGTRWNLADVRARFDVVVPSSDHRLAEMATGLVERAGTEGDVRDNIALLIDAITMPASRAEDDRIQETDRERCRLRSMT
ncbi:MAG: MmgE/PrpD family protein, partial [Solirubrobacteraceae bacterium]